MKDNDRTLILLLLIRFTIYTVLRNSVYKMEKSYREFIRTRNQDSRFIVTKITMQLKSSVQLGRIIFVYHNNFVGDI